MLTPANHAAIRRQIILIPAYVWLVYGWSSLFVHLPFGLPGVDPHVLRDFAHFYVQGIIANQHDARALYDIHAQAAILKRVVPGGPDILYPPVHGPQVALFFAPLARLPYAAALAIWQLLTLIVYAICGVVFWKVCPRLHDRSWMVFLLLLAAPALRFTLSFGQTAAIGLALFTAAFFALRADRRFLAGLAIGSLAYKPQLGLAAAIVFVGAGEWRVVAGAVTAAAAQFLVGALYWGPNIFVDYVGALRQLPDVTGPMEITFQMHSWRAFFALMHLPASVSMVAYLATAGVTAALAVACWRSKGSLALRYSVLLVATVLINPHMYAYDLIVLMPAFILLWDRSLCEPTRSLGEVFPRLGIGGRWSFAQSLEGLLYFCYFSPLFGILATVTRIQLSVIGLMLLGLAIASLLLVGRAANVFEEGHRPLSISL